MKTLTKTLLLTGAIALASQASALTYTEDFSGTFPAWESGWLGQNSNLQNYYGVGAGRGNNAHGLWIDDGDGIVYCDTVEIFFESSFAASLVDIALDLGSHIAGTTLRIFDMDDNILLETIVPTGNAIQGNYSSFAIGSNNGIKGFSLSNTAQIEGNTGIDNVVVNAREPQLALPPQGSPVPDSGASLGLLALGVALLAGARRRACQR